MCLSLDFFYLDVALLVQHYTGEDAINSGLLVRFMWIRWLVDRIRSFAGKLARGWETNEVRRTAKLYDHAPHGKHILG